MKSPITMQSSAVSRNALVLIATVAAGAALYWLRDILTPLAMAVFLLIMIDGVKRSVAARTPLNDRWAGTAALLLVVLAFFASIAIIVNGAAGFFGEASGVSQNIGPRIDQIIRDVYALIRLNNPPTAQDLINGVDLRGYLTSVAFQVQGIASGAFFVLVYLGFLLASQIGFRRKIIAMFPHRHQRDEAIAVFNRVRGWVEGYLWVQTVTGALICAAA
jgi:predicted PurR-regulated permease PerM